MTTRGVGLEGRIGLHRALWRVVCRYVTTLVLLASYIACANPNFNDSEKPAAKTILVFGGNGFIGSATVEKLLRVNHTVVIVNRGNWYWDSADTVKPHVTQLTCDRMQSLQKCSDLQHYLWDEHSPAFFDVVVDFSGYHPFEISDAFELLRGKIGRYVYISSDSVYEVCNKTHSGFSREEDAVRPELPDDVASYGAMDDYGNRKLKCEEELQKQTGSDDSVKYIIFRLPDVVGPRDNTYRWWIYQLWVRLSDFLHKRLSVPRDYWSRPISFVYVDDVADMIVDVIGYGDDVYNQAYNLANEEHPTIVEYLHDLMDTLDVEDIEILPDDDERYRLFPSVKQGPVDTTKARRVLGWNPTSWIDVMEATTSFYESAITNRDYDKARREVVKAMQDYFSEDPVMVNQGLREIYDVVLAGSHDEL